MYHEYPYTTYFHDIDKMCKHCHGPKYRLEVVNDYLKLIDDHNNVISAVKISYAEKALLDADGNPIKAYIIEGSTDGDKLVLTHGDGTITSLTIPYAEKAEHDIDGKDLMDYVYAISVSGDNIRVKKGDGNAYELTVPYAVKASTDVQGKEIRTYAANIIVDGNNVVLKDADGRELDRITVRYAETANADSDGNVIKESYAASMNQTERKLQLVSKSGVVLDEEVIDYAVHAKSDINDVDFRSGYGASLVPKEKTIELDAPDGTKLSRITVPFATLSTDATNAFENVEVVGDKIVFTTKGGVNYEVTAPYAVKASKDDKSNDIASTYFAGVANDQDTGMISFLDANGEVIATLLPTVTRATFDSYGNEIGDYINKIEADNQSDYVIITHGNGQVESVQIQYSVKAWKDSLGQPIQNTYVTDITFEYNEDEGRYEMVLWNGDIPKAEIGRVVVIADRARADKNGRDLTTYIGNVEADEYHIDIVNGADEIVNKISCDVKLESTQERVNTVHDRNVPTTFSYDSTDKALVITPGTALTTDSMLLVQSTRVKSVTFNNEEV